MTPAALLKAQALRKHLLHAPDAQGASVLLSTREAWELLDWYVAEVDSRYTENLEEAKAFDDPWDLLAEFNLLGFKIRPLVEAGEVH